MHVTLESWNKKVYKELDLRSRSGWRSHYHDMQDIEFTIERGRLCGCCSVASVSGTVSAAVKMAVDMVKEAPDQQRRRPYAAWTADQLDELLHPVSDVDEKRRAQEKATGGCWLEGLNGRSRRRCSGQSATCSTADRGRGEEADQGRARSCSCAYRDERPRTYEGMNAAAEAILTSRGGMTSARGSRRAPAGARCCIVGCGDLDIDYARPARCKIDGEDVIRRRGLQWLSHQRVHQGAHVRRHTD